MAEVTRDPARPARVRAFRGIIGLMQVATLVIMTRIATW
jgi:hypothetical protein